MHATRRRNWLNSLVCGVMFAAAAVCTTGCQISVGGQTLPSPYYIQDDVQFFPSGSEFMLSREAAAQKLFNSQEQLLTP